MINFKNASKVHYANGKKKIILTDITQTIPSGINVGIVGNNGVGKSTLLRLIGGVDELDSGTIQTNSSTSWPMGFSGGFQGSMTGSQNADFVCSLYANNHEHRAKAKAIVREFAELGEYFDVPVKKYSSGMRARLAFGLSLAFDFDYLLVDEIMSVGDNQFREKSKRALEQKLEKSNVIMVSHDNETLKQFCTAGIVMYGGMMLYFDKIDDALRNHQEILNQYGGITI